MKSQMYSAIRLKYRQNKPALTNPLPLWIRNPNERYKLKPRVKHSPPAAGGRPLNVLLRNSSHVAVQEEAAPTI